MTRTQLAAALVPESTAKAVDELATRAGCSRSRALRLVVATGVAALEATGALEAREALERLEVAYPIRRGRPRKLVAADHARAA